MGRRELAYKMILTQMSLASFVARYLFTLEGKVTIEGYLGEGHCDSGVCLLILDLYQCCHGSGVSQN